MIEGMDALARAAARSGRTASPLPNDVARLVRAVSLAVFFQWAGAGAILPLLPLYVRRHGGSDVVVGAVMAGYFAAAFVFQYGGGRLSDRWGRLPVVLGGLSVFAVGSLLFFVPTPAVFDVVWRALQGAGAGAAEVAALAMIAQAVPLSHRGRAVSRIYSAQLGGFAVGPVLGSLAGVGSMRVLFAAAAMAAIAAMVPVVSAGRAARAHAEAPRTIPPLLAAKASLGGPGAEPSQRGRRSLGRPLVGALLGASVVGMTGGVYEACWTLLMTRNGAVAWQIGLSWTLFALPFAVVARPGGWLADHLDRRWLAVVALGWSAAFCATYPFVPGVVPLLVMGSAEAFGFAIGLPACQSLLGEASGPGTHGHAQGLFAASQTGTTALAAACAGALYGVRAFVPFVGAAACCAVLLLAMAVVWRPVPRRVHARARSEVPAAP